MDRATVRRARARKQRRALMHHYRQRLVRGCQVGLGAIPASSGLGHLARGSVLLLLALGSGAGQWVARCHAATIVGSQPSASPQYPFGLAQSDAAT